MPGGEGGAITRDTLLPGVDGVRLERGGEGAWLAFEAAPENLWPRLLAFARKEKYRIAETEPTAGLLFTQWRPASEVREGTLLRNLIGGDDFTRLGFRLERTIAGGARLFVRRQTADEDIATAAGPVAWPDEAGNPDENGDLLARLLVFLGVEEQRARGVLSEAAAASVLDTAALSTGPAGEPARRQPRLRARLSRGRRRARLARARGDGERRRGGADRVPRRGRRPRADARPGARRGRCGSRSPTPRGGGCRPGPSAPRSRRCAPRSSADGRGGACSTSRRSAAAARGNSVLIRSATSLLLVDCGFTLKETTARMAALDVTPRHARRRARHPRAR